MIQEVLDKFQKLSGMSEIRISQEQILLGQSQLIQLIRAFVRA